MRDAVERILEVLSEYPQLTIVSYGIAPNPNGFCFEYDDSYYGEMPPEKITYFEMLLNTINYDNKMTQELKQELGWN